MSLWQHFHRQYTIVDWWKSHAIAYLAGFLTCLFLVGLIGSLL